MTIALHRAGAARAGIASDGLASNRLAITAMFGIAGVAIGAWTARIPTVQHDLRLSDGQLSIALLALAVGGLTGMRFAGRLVDRLGTTAVIAPAALILGGALALTAMAPNLAALGATLLIFGIIHGTLNVAMNAAAVARQTSYQRPIMTGFHAFFSIGGAAGAAVSAFCAHVQYSCERTFTIVGAALTLTAMVAIRRLAPAGGPGPAKLPEGTTGHTAGGQRRRILLLGVLALCALISEGAAADWSSVYLDRLGATPVLAAAAYAAFAGCMTFGRLAGDRITAATPPVLLLRCCGVIAAAGLAVGVVLGSPVAAIVGFGLLGAGLSCVIPLVFSAAGMLDPSRPGAVLSQVAAMGYVGYVTGPVAIGTAAMHVGLGKALLILPALLAVLVLGAAVIRPSAQPAAGPRSAPAPAAEPHNPPAPASEHTVPALRTATPPATDNARRPPRRERRAHRRTMSPLPDLDPRLAAVLERIATAAPTNIGFPAATDIDYRPFAPFLGHMINNVGDPGTDGTYPAHTKDIERDVLTWYADLFRAPPNWTGYTTSGGTEGVLTGLLHARAAFSDAVVYASSAAHYSVAKAAAILRLPLVQVAATADGEMDYSSLRAHAAQHPGQAAIVVATIGTTMTEAVDNVPFIHAALDLAGIHNRWIHADAALAGLPLVLRGRRDFDLAPGGADSISTSGHKWWGTPIPCGVTLSRRPQSFSGESVDYVGARDTTVTGSRAGLAPLMLWHAITRHDEAGHRRRACRGDEVAAYAHQRLIELGWPCWRNPDALTVMIRPLPESLRQRWPLPVDGGWSHLVCMPGRTRQHIDNLLADLRRELPRRTLGSAMATRAAPQPVG